MGLCGDQTSGKSRFLRLRLEAVVRRCSTTRWRDPSMMCDEFLPQLEGKCGRDGEGDFLCNPNAVD
jgi:hypothetical protein